MTEETKVRFLVATKQDEIRLSDKVFKKSIKNIIRENADDYSERINKRQKIENLRKNKKVDYDLFLSPLKPKFSGPHENL